MFWVISVYFNIRNTLPKWHIPPGTPCVYIYIYIYIYIYEGESNENLKSAIKIRTTALLSLSFKNGTHGLKSD